MLRWLREGLAWRWQRTTRLRYLRRTFRNGAELAESYLKQTACDTAVCGDRTVIQHPPGRTGLAVMILEVWFEEVYTGRFYRPAPGDVVIDAGANIGLLSLLVARSQPSCKVYAFEPFAENFRLLTANLAAAGASGVSAYPFALTGKSGTASMADGGGRSQDHQLVADSAANPGAVRTCSISEVLDMTGAKTIQLFKCDIEGSEWGLFTEASSETLQRCQRYALEYHDNIRAGTLDMLVARLSPTHVVEVHAATEGQYGMLYATAKPAAL